VVKIPAELCLRLTNQIKEVSRLKIAKEIGFVINRLLLEKEVGNLDKDAFIAGSIR
jgi:hypothetical protein